MTFWQTPEWEAYERACGDAPGTRQALLEAADWRTQVVDLSADERALWRGVRKSYKPLVHKAERNYDLWVLGYSVPGISAMSPLAMARFRAVHAELAGRETRPAETWQAMEGWLQDGHGLLAAAYEGQEWRAFAYFFVHETWAYYASAACLDEDVNHALVWTAMLALKARGVARLEMGWQGEATDAKGKQIEFFRRGFGGTAVPVQEVLACA